MLCLCYVLPQAPLICSLSLSENQLFLQGAQVLLLENGIRTQDLGYRYSFLLDMNGPEVFTLLKG